MQRYTKTLILTPIQPIDQQEEDKTNYNRHRYGYLEVLSIPCLLSKSVLSEYEIALKNHSESGQWTGSFTTASHACPTITYTTQSETHTLSASRENTPHGEPSMSVADNITHWLDDVGSWQVT